MENKKRDILMFILSWIFITGTIVYFINSEPLGLPAEWQEDQTMYPNF